MDTARFEALAQAYGSDLRRWPADERPTAEAFRAAEPATARAILAEAETLDELLFASPALSVSPALRAAVLAGAPKARLGRAAHGLGFWLSGAGLAAAGVAGVLVGAALTSTVVREAQADAVLAEVMPDEVVDILPLSAAPIGGVA